MTTRSHDVRGPLFRLTVVPGWVALGAVTLAFAGGFSLPLTYQFVPLVASVVLFGLPHGAVDHLAPTRVRGASATTRSLAAVGLLYALVGGLYATVWFVAPVAAFAAFILVTWLHWGQGEIHSLVALLGVDHLRTPTQRALTALSRGALPMLVPLVAFPDQYRFVAETLVGLFASPTLGPVDAAFTSTGRSLVAALVAVLIAVSFALGYARAESHRDWLLDASEVGLLVSFFAVVPPVLAVGLYFTCWHALRHIGRLMAIDIGSRRTLAGGHYTLAVCRFGRDAAPLTAVSVLFLGVFYWFVPVSPGELSEWVGLYLVLIAALTLPHVLVVGWLDREQDVWSTRPALLTERPGGES